MVYISIGLSDNIFTARMDLTLGPFYHFMAEATIAPLQVPTTRLEYTAELYYILYSRMNPIGPCKTTGQSQIIHPSIFQYEY